MTRLQIIRTYFMERFFASLTTDPVLASLRYPAEIFDASGNFIIPADLGGFVRIPSFENLRQRIAAAPPGKEHDDLSKFLQILGRCYNQITGGLDKLGYAQAQAAVTEFAPLVRHPDGQTYFPIAMHNLLNFQDGTLTARLYSASGQSGLNGRVYDLMFENPDVPAATGLPNKPFQSRVPFVATVGLGPTDPGFPITPLSTGNLDLTAADTRLTPGRMPLTLYAEVKRLPGAIILNESYKQASQMPGRFADLRNNRIHLDPLSPITAQTARSTARKDNSLEVSLGRDASVRGTIPPATGPYMVVFHGFYPVDDEERRRPSVGATNREFHHLAMGLLIPSERDNAGDRLVDAAVLPQNTFVFTCTGPDYVRMIPLNHPFLQKVDNQGNPDPSGSHVVLYCIVGSPSGWMYADQPSDGNKSIIQDSVAKDAPWAGRLLGGATFVGIAAGIGCVAGPVGCLVGAAVGLVVYALISVFCFLFGCGSHDNDQFQQHPAFDPPSSDNSFTQSLTNDVAPQGISQSSGGNTPAQTFDLKMIPHFYDRNLYGLHAGGTGTLQIDDNTTDQETLAWHSFPAGIGYQFSQEVPGAIDIAGSSIRNYFDLFTKKYEEVRQATAAVTYFG